jgi:hypothetical protein
MWNLWRNKRDCEAFLNTAEKVAEWHPGALTQEKLWSEMPGKFRSHLEDCEACAQNIDDMVTARNALRDDAAPGSFDAPWFATRVMARISVEERMLAGRDALWSVLPRLASRFSGVALIVIVVTGGWLMRRPAEHSGIQNTTESVFDTAGPITHDDVLISVLEKGR